MSGEATIIAFAPDFTARPRIHARGAGRQQKIASSCGRLKYPRPVRNNTVVINNRNIRIAILTLLAAMPALFLLLAQRSLKEYRGLQPGDLLPEARLQAADRTWVETATWRGAPTLLVVYQPGCKACQLELETLAAVAPSFPSVKIVLLSTKSELTGALSPLQIYSDPGGSFLAKVRRLITPTVYWINDSGEVRFARVGHRNAKDEEELFRRLLQDRR
jgi:hypothetical protein